MECGDGLQFDVHDVPAGGVAGEAKLELSRRQKRDYAVAGIAKLSDRRKIETTCIEASRSGPSGQALHCNAETAL